MDSAGLPDKLRKGLWAECACTATMFENMLVTPTKQVSSFAQLYNKEPSYACSLKPFGDIGAMANHANKKIRGKLADRGKLATFLGYPDNHSNDVYCMWNLKTERIVNSRDVLWLHKSYEQYHANDQDNEDYNVDDIKTPDLEAGRETETVAPAQVEGTVDEVPTQVATPALLNSRQQQEMLPYARKGAVL
jgi:hypothetical protein